MGSSAQHVNAKTAELLKRFAKNQIVINSAADFAIQDTTTIRLEEGFEYVGGDNFITSKRFIVEANVSIRATVDTEWEFTGTGSMFTATSGGTFSISLIRLTAPNAIQLFSTSFGTPASSVVLIDRISSSGILKVGTFNNTGGIVITESAFRIDETDDGISLEGSIATLVIRDLGMATSSATFVGLDFGTAVISADLNINDFFIDGVAGAVGMSGLTNSGNVAAGIIASFNGCQFKSPMTPLVGISESDLQLEFTNCFPIPDSSKDVDTFLTASRTVPIVTQSVFVAIAGTDWSSDESERFSTTNAGLVTYLSPVSTKTFVSITATVEKVGGGANLVEMKIAINGTVQDKTVGGTDSNNPTQITSQGLFTLTTNDTIQAFVANQDSMVDIIVNDSNLTVINGF